MKILHIIPGLPTGGAERALVKLVESSDKNTFLHHVVTLSGKGTQGDRLVEGGAVIHELNMTSAKGVITGIISLRKLVHTIKPNVIHAWMYHGGLASLLLSNKTPRVLAIRHALHDPAKLKRSTRLIIRLLALLSGRFESIIYNSTVSKTQHEKIGYKTDWAIAILNGFQVFPRDLLKTKSEIFTGTLLSKKSGPVFSQIARYHPYKNHVGMLRAFAKVTRSFPDASLILAGAGCTSDNTTLVTLIQQLKLNDNVELTGDIDDVTLLLRHVDVLVSPSTSEAFPNVIGEAMACEVPCIGTDVGDSAYIIGDTGIVVRPNDSEALANAMIRMANMSKEERKQLGRMGRLRIIDHFPTEKSTEAYEALYQQLNENR